MTDVTILRDIVHAYCTCAGEKLESLLHLEAAQQRSAAVEATELQQQLADVSANGDAAKAQLQATAAQLEEAQQALVDADKLHSRALRRAERRVVMMERERDAAHAELQTKATALLHAQAALREAAGQHHLQLAAAADQARRLLHQAACYTIADVLCTCALVLTRHRPHLCQMQLSLQASLQQAHIEQLQAQLQQASNHKDTAVQEAISAAEQRNELQLREQQLLYEQRLQVCCCSLIALHAPGKVLHGEMPAGACTAVQPAQLCTW